MPQWTDEDRAAANLEGWDIWETSAVSAITGATGLEIERIDDPQPGQRVWGDDVEVWMCLWTTASELHWKALRIIMEEDPDEWERILSWVWKPCQCGLPRWLHEAYEIPTYEEVA